MPHSSLGMCISLGQIGVGAGCHKWWPVSKAFEWTVVQERVNRLKARLRTLGRDIADIKPGCTGYTAPFGASEAPVIAGLKAGRSGDNDFAAQRVVAGGARVC